MRTGGEGWAIGIAVGVAIGVAIGNIGAGIAIGVAIGAGIATTQRKKSGDAEPKSGDSGDESPPI
jgi:F0F1-type ATP synthase membrane subunit c/vacuolar-type H+-ATPase subunit K